MQSNIIKRLAMEIPSIYQPRDKLTNTEYLRTNFSTIISTREEANRIKIRPMPHQEGTVHCFTDGSKNDQSSGTQWSELLMSLEIYNFFLSFYTLSYKYHSFLFENTLKEVRKYIFSPFFIF